jgi:hypothetical protein
MVMGKPKERLKSRAEKSAGFKRVDDRTATGGFAWSHEWFICPVSCLACLEVIKCIGKPGISLTMIICICLGCNEQKEAAFSKKTRTDVTAPNGAVGKAGNGDSSAEGSNHFVPDDTWFDDCSFVGVSFNKNVWNTVNFRHCNFAFADLSSLDFDPHDTNLVRFWSCNFYGVTNAPPGFLNWVTHRSFPNTNYMMAITNYEKWQVFIHSNIWDFSDRHQQ